MMSWYAARLALRSLLYRRRQYVSLFLVCMVGVAISLAAISLSHGMMRSMDQKARIYYGGDFALMCSVDDEGLEIWDYAEKLAAVQAVLPADAVVAPRMDFDARHSSFYFEGAQALQQTIKGVRFDLEADLLSGFTFLEGGIDVMAGSDGVLLSAPVARLLNVRVGDAITFLLETVDDYENTVQVVVRGIFQDSSVFGMYTSYMDFDFLKTAYGRPANFANRICVHFPSRTIGKRELRRFYDALASVLPLFPYITVKDDYIDATEYFTEETWGFIPLAANLSEVSVMELAMDAVVTFIIIMLTVIIVAGIGSTYRVLIMKRITEIGIYMAVGMKRRTIMTTLLLEALLLLVAGCLAGMALCAALTALVAVPDLSFIPSFDLFLTRGHLAPEPDSMRGALVIASVVFVTLLAVLGAARKSIKIMPVQALAVTE